MKIECACGTKYSFDVTPEMVRDQVQFICKNCGVDSSAMVNELIRQQFGSPGQPAPVAARPAPIAVQPATAGPAVARAPAAPGHSTPAPAQPAPASRPVVVKVASKAAPAPEVVSEAPQLCLRHPGQLTIDHCRVCQKPICPKCMELFGFVCSALCKGKAELQGLNVPVYQGQKAVVEAKRWRRIGLIATLVSVGVLAVMGAWGWYAWVGSVPRATFALRFPEAGFSGRCRLVPPDQIVFLHGGMVARHDMKAKKEIWSHWLIDKKKIAQDAAAAFEEAKAAYEKLSVLDRDMPSLEDITLNMTAAAQAAFQLHVHGQNIWIAGRDKLVQFDWNTGKPAKEISVEGGRGEWVRKGDELVWVAENERNEKFLQHVHLASGESRTQQIASPAAPALAAAGSTSPGAASRQRGSTNKSATATMAANTSAGKTKTPPTTPASAKGTTAGKPLDSEVLAAKVQNMPMPNRLALPATIAANANQQRLRAEMRDASPVSPVPAERSAEGGDEFTLVSAPEGFLQFSARLLESKKVQREAMKAPPKKSALEGEVNAAASAAVANEILNEIQRDAAGSVVEEDVSRYQVKLRRPGFKEDWTAEVNGWATLLPLQTVDVVAAGKSLLVLDKTNKRLWESKLNYQVKGHVSGLNQDNRPYGEGPCVERGDTLYVFDEGVVSAFDLATGNARWRLPSVGVIGLFFDPEGMLYVNTTTASPEGVKYSRQIDVTQKVRNAVVKVDPKTGKTLWTAEADGFVTHVSGKFIYTIESYVGDRDDDDLLGGTAFGMRVPAHVRIKRLAAKTGQVLWEHYQPRFPLDVQFDKNTIQLLFKKELQHLKFFSL